MYIKIVNRKNFDVKKCKVCGVEKQVGAFSKSDKSSDGYMDVCKYCRSLEIHKEL